MLIYHVTNIESALNIIKQKEYIPYYTMYSYRTLCVDFCLNCFLDINKALYSSQPLKKGCMLVFNWEGSVLIYNEKKDKWPCEPNILYNHPGWRYFIPSSTDKHLKFENIIIDKDLLTEDFRKNILRKIPYLILKRILAKKLFEKLITNIINTKKAAYMNEIQNFITQNKGQYIKVMG